MAFTPHAAARRSILRANELLAAAGPSSGIAVNVRADMRRLSVVMAVSALDTYMHRLIVERAYTHDELPVPLARLEVSFSQLLAQADETKTAAKSAPHSPRPRVGVKRQLRDRLLRETFQRFDDVSTALAMAGQKRQWEQVGQRMNPPMSPADIRVRLNHIVDRRNQIVHEGDYRRLERPRRSDRNPMTTAEARGHIDFLSHLIDAIHSIV